MDPRDRADAVLQRAGAQGHDVVTPINATSPMDASATSRIGRAVIDDAQQRLEDEDTQSIPAPGAEQDEITQPVRKPAPVRQQAPTREEPPAGEEPSEEETEKGGLIPTVAKQQKRSGSLADRLAGRE